jgi:hypothetical protein
LILVGSMGVILLFKNLLWSYLTILGFQLDFIRLCGCILIFKTLYKFVTPFGWSNLTSLGFINMLLIFKTLQQVYNFICGSNFTSLGFVNTNLNFKGPWGFLQLNLKVFFELIISIFLLWFWFPNFHNFITLKTSYKIHFVACNISKKYVI